MSTLNFTLISPDIIGMDLVTIVAFRLSKGVAELVLDESLVHIEALALVVVAAWAAISLLLLDGLLIAVGLAGALLGCRLGRVIARAIITKN